MFLVQMIIYNKFRYWLAKDGDKWYFTGLFDNAFKFTNKHLAEDKGRVYCKTEFTIEKVIE